MTNAGESFSANERWRAISAWSGFTAITSAADPVLGGWLVQNIAWRAVFFINLPVAAIVVAITLAKVPESRIESYRVRSLDWMGALLVTLGLGRRYCLCSDSAIHGRFLSPRRRSCLGRLSLVEARTPSPMLPIDLFCSLDFNGAILLTLFLYTASAASYSSFR